MKHRVVRFLIKVVRLIIVMVAVAILFLTILFFLVTSPPKENQQNDNVINDVTGLNSIHTRKVHEPTTVTEITDLIRNFDGPVSIGGARHSMGGQIGLDSSLHLDMRKFNQVIAFSDASKEITVQSGITWREVQEFIDPYNLSVMIMQTYANFTVGGSLSVNVHGRYIGHGAIVHSVRSIRVVLPDGELINASPSENSKMFYGSIGGYGGLGVIVEATLKLADNCRVKRESSVIPYADYYDYFMKNIRNDSLVIFHNADLYPNSYDEVRSVSYKKTEMPVTIEDRLKPMDKSYRFERFAMYLVSEMPGGKWIRHHWGDPIIYDLEQVKWRNFEASFDALELEPSSREQSTYVLQEYFVPVEHFNSFVPKIAKIFNDHDVNVINVSVRHAKADTVTMLSWAPQEVFCFVIYYKQETSKEEMLRAGVWTRELIDAALSEDGRYYLPYQLHATTEQFEKAYPNHGEFFQLKQEVDPQRRFLNRMWEKYYVPK